MKVNNCIKCGNNRIEIKENGIIKCPCGNIILSFKSPKKYIKDWNYSNPAPKRYIKSLETDIAHWKKIIDRKRREIVRVKKMIKK